MTAAREAVADLVGGTAAGVVFGPSATGLTYTVAGTLAKTWRTGDEVVVSRLDHDANVRPWVQAAQAAASPCGGRSSTRRPANCRPTRIARI